MAEMMIIDTDVGMDDAIALMLALTNPSRCKIVAITCVSGNVELSKVYPNVLRVLKFCNQLQIPVYKGCQKAIIPCEVDATIHHGEDGLGGAADRYPPPCNEVPSMKVHASVAMVQLVKKHPRQITLMALGPLTNLAVAQRLDRNFLRLLKELIIMGGTVDGIGNVTPVGEFNFVVDPESASVVLSEVQCKTKIVPADTCARSRLDWKWYDRWVGVGTEKSDFVRDVNAAMVDRFRNKLHYPGFVSCDPLAMVAFVNPAAVTKVGMFPAVVELWGSTTRGALIVDHRMSKGKSPPVNSFEFILEFDMDVVKEMYIQMIHFGVPGNPRTGVVGAVCDTSSISVKADGMGEELLIIDTDVGVDDALAIMMALSNPAKCKVLAITCVAGNVGLSGVYTNTLRLLSFLGKQQAIPVFLGCRTALVPPAMTAHNPHPHYDIDGFGGVSESYPLPKDDLEVPSEHASIAIVEIVRKNPGVVTLVCLGPLTNIALAHRLDPAVLQNLKELVIMGGTVEGKGNETAVAEFNFSCDPEAASIVLGEAECSIRLVPYEPCLKHAIEWDWYDQWTSKGTEKANFVKKVTAQSAEWQRDMLKRSGYMACDLVAMAAVLEPSLVTRSERFPATVELHGTATRGMLVVDRRPSFRWHNKVPHVKFLMEFNANTLKEMYLQMVQ